MNEYLNSFQDVQKVYYLNKAGRELIGSDRIIAKTAQFHHTLLRNDIYVHFGCPEMWKNEYAIPFDKEKIIADAIFQVGQQQYFLEVDNLQKMKTNAHKLKQYLRFKNTEKWQNSNNGKFPVVLFYTAADIRKSQLLELNPPGLHLQVLTKKDLI